jgi:hypothetical protein
MTDGAEACQKTERFNAALQELLHPNNYTMVPSQRETHICSLGSLRVWMQFKKM